LLHRLESDRGPNRRQKASSQLRPRKKIYAGDHGLISALSSVDPLVDPDVRARLVEAAVFRHLREARRHIDAQLGYFRRDDDLEVDFIWRMARGKAVAIEVTSSHRLRKSKVSRAQHAAAAAAAARKVLVYDGLISDGNDRREAVPLHRFLLEPLKYLES